MSRYRVKNGTPSAQDEGVDSVGNTNMASSVTPTLAVHHRCITATVEWNNSTLITGDVAEYVAGVKRHDGPEIQVHGSPGLIQTLLEHDLIDEHRLWIFPVVIGTGKRLFGEGTIPAALKLPGSMEFDQPTEAEIERRQRLTAR